MGYNNCYGSDVAWIFGKYNPQDFICGGRNFQAFCVLFMNGGHGERRLWK